MSDLAGTVSERLFRALAVDRDSAPAALEDLAAITLWRLREDFLRQLAGHPSPRQAGECVWQQCEPWISAVGDVMDRPEVLLAEVPDWAALLDRHSVVRLECTDGETRIYWDNAPGLAADARECLVRHGALSGLLSWASAQARPRIRHIECRVRGAESCVFAVENLTPCPDPPHARLLREAFLVTSRLQGHEVLYARLKQFSARHAPFPDVRGLRAVRRFMEEVEDIILVFDRELCVLDANQAALRFAGMTLPELRGLSARDLLSAESFEAVRKSQPLLFARGALSGLQVQGRSRHGLVPLEVSARVAENGESMVCIARDVSAHLRLERELEARNKQLEEQNKRISESGRLKSEFLANVSHELTTPLTCMRGFAKLLHGDLEGVLRGEEPRLSTEKRLEFLRIVQDEARRMGELMSGLMELSKMESGVVTLDRARVSLNTIMQACLLVLKPRLDELSLRVRCSLDENLPQALMDPDRMKQVMLNLLDNAIKFSTVGSEITVRTGQTADAVLLSVRNPSSELREADLARIFARFIQRDGSFSRQYGGVGLGLDLVRATVELHGGHVWAQLPEPGYVEFILEIPLIER